jgi:membrane dipeptidase
MMATGNFRHDTWRATSMKNVVKSLIIMVVILFGLAAFAAQRKSAGREEKLVAKAKAIHQRIIPLDSHVDVSPQLGSPGFDPGSEKSTQKWDLVKMEKGGLKGVFLAVFVGQRPDLNEQGYKLAYDAAMAKFEAIHRLAEKIYPERCALATSPSEVERIAATGKRVIIIGMENGYPIGNDLALIQKYYDLGTRYITLCHSGNNQICDSSSAKEPLHNGLSEFGKKVVAEMNRLGIMVDVSHIAEKSFWDVLAVSKSPIIASHSGCSALNPVDRNLTDKQLKALAKNGGVIQIVALASYLKADSPERRQATDALRKEMGMGRMSREEMQKLSDKERAEYQARRNTYQERMRALDVKFPPATLSDFVDHIDHAVKVAGINHVGVGTDFDGGGGIPGFNDESEALNVTTELVRRGYNEEQIRKIWGGNLLRVWREVKK